MRIFLLTLAAAGLAAADELASVSTATGWGASSAASRALGVLSSLLRPPAAIPSEAAAEVMHTVPLRKQYVPITKNGTTVAYKTAYFGSVYVGSPEPQPFTVVFDTGSGHLILPSTGCDSETCMKHRRYDPSSSTTSLEITHQGEVLDETAESRDALRIKFGNGEVLGEFAHDRVCLTAAGGHCTGVRMILATEMSPQPFGLFEFDGVLGLGTNALALNDGFSFFGQMVSQYNVMQPRFAVFLARTDEGQSAITFGGYQKQCAASEVQWVPVALPELGYWQVQLKSVRIGGQELEDCADGSCRAILDTGTSLLGVPKSASRGMQRMLARPVPDELASAPNPLEDTDCRDVEGAALEFDLGGPVVTLAPSDYSRPKPYNMTTPNTTDGWRLWCRSLLLPLDMKAPIGPLVFIWGEPVLRRYFTIYDWDKKQVGLSVSGQPPKVVGDFTPGAIGLPPASSLLTGVPMKPPTFSGSSAAAPAQESSSAESPSE